MTNWFYKLSAYRAQLVNEHAQEIETIERMIFRERQKIPPTIALFDPMFASWQNHRLSHGEDSSTVKTSNLNTLAADSDNPQFPNEAAKSSGRLLWSR